MAARSLVVLGLVGWMAAPTAFVAPPAEVVPNDNRVAAGTIRNDTLTISLVLDLATWRPEGPEGPSVVVPAFAEEGKAPSIPAPLIRVPEGTVIRARIRSMLDTTMTLHGLFTRPDTTTPGHSLGARATIELTFPAGEAGTYLYGTLPEGYEPDRTEELEQTFGALIVDPPGALLNDRVLVINIWGQRVDSQRYRNALAINGLSWPETERFEASLGDSLHWRVINASARFHPMHLHGFYFAVLARGGIGRDEWFSAGQRRLMVTELMAPYSTMAMSWSPDRPGNWLFHCHLSFHVVPATRLGAHDAGSTHAPHGLGAEHMAGLVVGITVRPPPGLVEPERLVGRRLRVYAQEGRQRGRAPRAMGFVLQRDGQAPAADSVEVPGAVLVLEQDVPTDVMVVNRMRDAVAVHWHGLELESWSDGVAGWSGAPGNVAPAIAPGDSFLARLSQPRAGTFIYHTHLNDIEQVTSGLYGALVVLPRGVRHDPATDHAIVLGWDSPDDPPHVLVNGDSVPRPLTLAAGVRHRLRFVNISPALTYRIRLRRDSVPVEWQRLALDGADLPPAQARVTPADIRVAVGQTADVGVTLPPGRYVLTYAHPAIEEVRQEVTVGGRR